MLQARGDQHWRTVRALLALNVVALIAVFLSSHWDAAEHAKGAVDRFWYAPHFGIYCAILAAALVAGIAGSCAGWWSGTALRRLRPTTNDQCLTPARNTPHAGAFHDRS